MALESTASSKVFCSDVEGDFDSLDDCWTIYIPSEGCCYHRCLGECGWRGGSSNRRIVYSFKAQLLLFAGLIVFSVGHSTENNI